ncbi:hypothetical protein MBOT_29700 [Mycobacterium botniense]|uniref:Uncharacterized protein n=1 Tax=Mycobacterium botniense TaxID=84962 RepID=A0A7I9Y0L4_9MYCO|nr:hypothetical protein MBOT_29700 [Mycobacterium botniense]
MTTAFNLADMAAGSGTAGSGRGRRNGWLWSAVPPRAAAKAPPGAVQARSEDSDRRTRAALAETDADVVVGVGHPLTHTGGPGRDRNDRRPGLALHLGRRRNGALMVLSSAQRAYALRGALCHTRRRTR